jgi:hypothetical protein
MSTFPQNVEFVKLSELVSILTDLYIEEPFCPQLSERYGEKYRKAFTIIVHEEFPNRYISAASYRTWKTIKMTALIGSYREYDVLSAPTTPENYEWKSSRMVRKELVSKLKLRLETSGDRTFCILSSSN